MRRNAALLFLIVLLTRWPFLGPGFGSDATAWRIAGAAREIARTGHYEASRFPGAPVVEIADSALLRLGPWALPWAVVLWGAIGVVAFYVTLCRLGMRGCFWAALALAFTPVFWINTTDAMDYAWALGLALVALAFAVHGRASLAGLALGLAVGCRIATAVLVVPIGLLLAGRGHVRFVLAFMLFGALALAPSFLTYGTRFLSGYEFGRVPWIYVIKGATRDVWGVIGSVVVAVATVAALFRVRAVPRRELAAVSLGILLTGAIYLRHPHEGAYLLPVVPFVILLLSRSLPQAAMASLAVLLAVSALFFDVHETVAEDGVPLAGRRIAVDSGHGPLVVERERRRETLDLCHDILERVQRLPANSIFMVYELLPVIQWLEPAQPHIVHLLAPDAVSRAKGEGATIWATANAISAEEEVYGVSMRDLGPSLMIIQDPGRR
jgi:hypothetical protein